MFFVGERFDNRLHFRQRFRDAESIAHEFHATGFHFREIKNVVDELQQMASAVENVVAVFQLPVVEFAKSFVRENFREADDGVERRAQFVAHVREELALGEVRGLGGVLGLLDGGLGLAALRDVLENAVGAHDAFARARGERAVVQPDPFAVLAATAVFHVEFFAVGKKFLIRLLHARRVFGMNPVQPQLPAEKFVGVIAQNFDDVAADVNQIAV